MVFLFTMSELFFPQYLQWAPCWIYTYHWTPRSSTLCLSALDLFCLILYFKWTFKIILQVILYCWGICTDKFYSLFSHHEDNLRYFLFWTATCCWGKQERTTARSLWGLNPISACSIGSCLSVPINLQYNRKKTDVVVQIPALLKKAL